MLQILQILDLLAVALTCVALIFLSITDTKYRTVPGEGVIALLIGGVILTFIRFILGNEQVVMTVEASLFLAGIITLTMSALVRFSGMVGIGDVLTVLAVSLMVPYSPLGLRVRMFPAIIPITTVLSVVMIYLKIRNSTMFMKDFPSGFKRVIRRKASELKKMNVLTEYPVYIEGLGYVYEKVFNGSPVKNTIDLIKSVPDDAIVYTTPNFPFVYYFTISFILVIGATLMLGIMELLGVIG